MSRMKLPEPIRMLSIEFQSGPWKITILFVGRPTPLTAYNVFAWIIVRRV